MDAAVEIVLYQPLSSLSADLLLDRFFRLSPDVRARVLESAGVVGVRRILVVGVIVAQRRIRPSVAAEVRELQLPRFALGYRAEPADHSFDFIVQQQNVVAHAGLGIELRPRSERVRNREHRQIALAEMEPFGLVHYDVNSEALEESENADRLARSRSIVVARNHHDQRIGKHLHETRELLVSVDYRRVCRTNAVKNVSTDENQVRLELDCLVDCLPERDGYIRLALVHSRRRLPLVLAEPEVQIGEVNESHCASTRSDWTTRVSTRIGVPAGGDETTDHTSIVACVRVIHDRRRSNCIVPTSVPLVSESLPSEWSWDRAPRIEMYAVCPLRPSESSWKVVRTRPNAPGSTLSGTLIS